VADACRTGAATDIIFGLALGYKSAIIPCIIIAVTIYVSFSLASMYGIACAALGMLTTMATGARRAPPSLPELAFPALAAPYTSHLGPPCTPADRDGCCALVAPRAGRA
jgi:hypothetical protein